MTLNFDQFCLIYLKNVLLVVFLQIVSKGVGVHQSSAAAGEDFQTSVKEPGVNPSRHSFQPLLYLAGQLLLKLEGLKVVKKPVTVEQVSLQLGLDSVSLLVFVVIPDAVEYTK